MSDTLRDAKIAELARRVEVLEAAQRWIPVSERLPEFEEMVLGIWTDWCDDIEVVRYTESGFWSNADRIRKIGYAAPTHWMPLPEPPYPLPDKGE